MFLRHCLIFHCLIIALIFNILMVFCSFDENMDLLLLFSIFSWLLNFRDYSNFHENNSNHSIIISGRDSIVN